MFTSTEDTREDVPGQARALHVVGQGHFLAQDVELPAQLAEHAAKDWTRVDANPHPDTALCRLANLSVPYIIQFA